MQNIDIFEQFSQLIDFLKEQLNRKILDFIQFNAFIQSILYVVCPGYGENKPRII